MFMTDDNLLMTSDYWHENVFVVCQEDGRKTNRKLIQKYHFQLEYMSKRFC